MGNEEELAVVDPTSREADRTKLADSHDVRPPGQQQLLGTPALCTPSAQLSRQAAGQGWHGAQDKRQTAFADYRNYIGMDISSLVQLPLFIMEPYTMLQKVAEIMEYSELLDRAATIADPYERCSVPLLLCMPCCACPGYGVCASRWCQICRACAGRVCSIGSSRAGCRLQPCPGS